MKQFTLKERRMLANLLKEECSYRQISPVIKKAISSISDEMNNHSKRRKFYDAYIAQRKAELKRINKHKRTKWECSYGLRTFIIEKIKAGWSPEQIAGYLKKEAQGKSIISHETIYQFIYSQEGRKIKLWKYLRHKKESYRRSWGIRKHRTKIPDRVSIHQRPRVINDRARFGDYEADLMIFSHTKKVLAVFVERRTRKVFAIVNEDKSSRAMEMALHEMITSAGIYDVKSITFDNGLENVCHEKVRNDYNNSFQTFFCDPYSSWQKGAVENMNKLLRQYLPRDIHPDQLTQDFVDFICQKLNNRPRKILNYKTPHNYFFNCSV